MILFRRAWAMPNANTFSIPVVRSLLDSYVTEGWVDPFSRMTPYRDLCITNDLNPDFDADFNIEALDFLRKLRGEKYKGLLFDPPYSPRQVSECYRGVGLKVSSKTTQSSWWTERKNASTDLIEVGGYAITFGWNSNGFGKNRGFELIEVMMVAHGGHHNDTIITVEKRVDAKLEDLFPILM